MDNTYLTTAELAARIKYDERVIRELLKQPLFWLFLQKVLKQP